MEMSRILAIPTNALQFKAAQTPTITPLDELQRQTLLSNVRTASDGRQKDGLNLDVVNLNDVARDVAKEASELIQSWDQNEHPDKIYDAVQQRYIDRYSLSDGRFHPDPNDRAYYYDQMRSYKLSAEEKESLTQLLEDYYNEIPDNMLDELPQPFEYQMKVFDMNMADLRSLAAKAKSVDDDEGEATGAGVGGSVEDVTNSLIQQGTSIAMDLGKDALNVGQKVAKDVVTDVVGSALGKGLNKLKGFFTKKFGKKKTEALMKDVKLDNFMKNQADTGLIKKLVEKAKSDAELLATAQTNAPTTTSNAVKVSDSPAASTTRVPIQSTTSAHSTTRRKYAPAVDETTGGRVRGRSAARASGKRKRIATTQQQLQPSKRKRSSQQQQLKYVRL